MNMLGRAHLSQDSIAPYIERALILADEEDMGEVEQNVKLGAPSQTSNPSAGAREAQANLLNQQDVLAAAGAVAGPVSEDADVTLKANAQIQQADQELREHVETEASEDVQMQEDQGQELEKENAPEKEDVPMQDAKAVDETTVPMEVDAPRPHVAEQSPAPAVEDCSETSAKETSVEKTEDVQKQVAAQEETESTSRGKKPRKKAAKSDEKDEANPPPPSKRQKTNASTSTPQSERVSSEAPEPTTAGRTKRQAASKAGNLLHDMAEDMNRYQKEKSRKDLIPPSERQAARVNSGEAGKARATSVKSEDVESEGPPADDLKTKTKSAAKTKRAKPAARTARSESVATLPDEDGTTPTHLVAVMTTGTKLTAAQTKVRFWQSVSLVSC